MVKIDFKTITAKISDIAARAASFFKSKKVYVETPAKLYSANSSVEFKEAYNSLALKVIHFSNESNSKIFAVTSSNYGEGKSGVALNLSISLSHNLLDKKILLIDSDMHSSHIKAFSDSISACENDSCLGLSDYLSNSSSELNFIKTKILNLDMIYSGTEPVNPAGLINSNRMKSLFTSLRDSYDYIIVNTSPVNVVSDALLISDSVDAYILSTKAKFSTVTMLNSASEALENIGAKILGVVLSK